MRMILRTDIDRRTNCLTCLALGIREQKESIFLLSGDDVEERQTSEHKILGIIISGRQIIQTNLHTNTDTYTHTHTLVWFLILVGISH